MASIRAACEPSRATVTRAALALRTFDGEPDDHRIMIGSGILADASGLDKPHAPAPKNVVDSELGQPPPRRPTRIICVSRHPAALGETSKLARERRCIEVTG